MHTIQFIIFITKFMYKFNKEDLYLLICPFLQCLAVSLFITSLLLSHAAKLNANTIAGVQSSFFKPITLNSSLNSTAYLSFSLPDSFVQPTSSPSLLHPSLHLIFNATISIYTQGDHVLIPITAGILFCCDGSLDCNRQIA